LKANMDVGWDFHTRRTGIGVTVRDSQGQPIISEWKFIPYCTTAEDVEVLACLEGLKHLINLRQWPTFLESDCLWAVSTFHHAEPDRSGSWILYREARELSKLHEDIIVQKVDCVNNSVAHVLAQLGKSGSNGLLRGAAPACVHELITKDCNMM
jgi:hypothetical protein